MKLVTYEPKSIWREERVGAMVDESNLVDLTYGAAYYLAREDKEPKPYELASILMPSSMMKILERWEKAKGFAEEILQYMISKIGNQSQETGLRGEKLFLNIDEVTLKAPVPRPGKIFAAGMNYAKHVQEGEKLRGKREIPPFPRGFVKVSTTVIGPDEPIILSQVTKAVSYEIELGVVIGKKGKYLTKENAFDCVAGYTIANDVSARDIQMEEMKYGNHLMGKNLDAQGPMGPYLVTKDEIIDPQDLDMVLKVNTEIRQSSNTKDMVHNVAAILERWSWATLEPGDLIWTGTPEGTATEEDKFLKDGDVVEAWIQGLGTLKNPVMREG
jgi:acylpyruvate hydrolase